MSDRLLISGLAVFTHCGITEEERAVGQRVLADVEMAIDLDRGALRGGLETTVDYADVCRQIVEIGDKARYALLESLAIEAAETVLARPRVREVRVRITKPGPPIAPTVGAFAVEVMRDKSRKRR
ncbi:MAG: dihydroneopterin aldolase [Nitrospirota bacterium]